MEQPFAPSAARASRDAAALLAAGRPRPDLFRHVVLQLLDDYASVRRLRGDVAAAHVFAEPPALTGDEGVDAALAALAEHLARRDGWQPPDWAFEPSRRALRAWWVPQLPGLQVVALRDSPLAFRRRGVFLDPRSLERV